MLLEDVVLPTEEDAAATSWRKSGSLAAMASAVGAACATDSSDVIEMAGKFGAHAGMVAQLVNDIDGVIKGERGNSADIRRRKKTLPVAYALTCAHEENIDTLLDWYGASADLDRSKHECIAQTIRDLGALHYTCAVAAVHQSPALEAIHDLTAHTGRPGVRLLSQLVSSLDTD